MRVLVIAVKPDLPESHLLAGLHRRGVELRVLCHPDAPHVGLFEQAGLPWEPFTIHGRFDRKAIRGIRKIVRQEGIDLVHTLMNAPLANAIWAASGTDVPIIAYRGVVGNIQWWNPASRMTYLHSRVARIACVCDAIVKDLKKQGVSERRLIRIYKGHDVNWYTAASREELCQTFNIPDDAWIVAGAAAMRPRKGTAVLLKAAAQVHVGTRPVHYLLLGDARDEEIQRVEWPGDLRSRVHFTGFRTDATRWTGAADVFVLPSLRREGLPKGAIEAMAQGVPAIVTHAGGSPELVRHEVDGLVVPPGDDSALASALNDLLTEPTKRQAWGASAQQRIAKDFNISSTIDAYTKLYTDVAS